MTSIGVLALQGDYREHLAVFERIGISAQPVKTANDLDAVDGLVVPGGESTVISKLSQTFNLFDPIAKLIRSGFPVFGTCAGLIMLADNLLDSASNQKSFGGLDVTVRRNAFGHQAESFESDLDFQGIDGMVHAVFIRAPIVETVGSGVEVLSRLADGRIIAVRQGNAFGISFHPELTNEDRIHAYFANIVRHNS